MPSYLTVGLGNLKSKTEPILEVWIIIPEVPNTVPGDPVDRTAKQENFGQEADFETSVSFTKETFPEREKTQKPSQLEHIGGALSFKHKLDTDYPERIRTNLRYCATTVRPVCNVS